MLTLLALITPMAMFDMVMLIPTHSVLLLTLLGGKQGRLRAWFYVVGFFVASFGTGVLIVISLERLINFLDVMLFDAILNPSPFDYVLQIGIAFGLLFLSYRLYCKLRTQPDNETGGLTGNDQDKEVGVIGSFVLGFVSKAVGLPSAFAYFAALDQMIKTGLGIDQISFAIGYYNTIMILPLVALIGFTTYAPDRYVQMVERASQFVGTWGQGVIFLLLSVFALVLILDSIGFLVFDSPVIPVTG